MKTQFLRLLLLSVLGFAYVQRANAQGPTVASEHRYFFRCPAEISTAAEKRLLEALRGLDPELVIAIDRPTASVKMLAQRAVDPSEIEALARQNGIVLNQRRVVGDRDGAYTFLE